MGQQKYRWWYKQGGSRLQSYMHEKCNQCSARYNQNRKELNHSSQSEWVHFDLMDACPKSPRMVWFVMDVLFKHYLSIWSHPEIPGKCFAYCRFLATTRKGVAKVPWTLFAILKSYAVLGSQKVHSVPPIWKCSSDNGWRHPGTSRDVPIILKNSADQKRIFWGVDAILTLHIGQLWFYDSKTSEISWSMPRNLKPEILLVGKSACRIYMLFLKTESENLVQLLLYEQSMVERLFLERPWIKKPQQIARKGRWDWIC